MRGKGVRVEASNELAARVLDAEVERGVLAAVSFLKKGDTAGVARRVLLSDGGGAVARAVVDDYYPKPLFGIVHSKQRVDGPRERLFLVKAGHQHGHLRVAGGERRVLFGRALFKKRDKQKHLKVEGDKQTCIKAQGPRIHTPQL